MKTDKSKEKRMYLRIRNLCGFLGMILPWLALFSAGIAPHPSDQWWWSISATYYQSPALVGVLVPAAIVLITYIGYNATDNLVTTLCGIFGLGIVLFPCKVAWLAAGTKVGFFQIPMETSHIIHTACAAIFFLLIALNSIFLFTKSGDSMTEKKKIRNLIYQICGWSMIALECVFVTVRLIGLPGYTVMILEILLLSLFGLSWLVKGEAFPFLNDDEESEEKIA
ncbi:MAG: hypothetical protein MJZ82_05640 [Paludibacteraceae bacterium]|nr:hypothetical protein [Paludibacteraceae bacterium]